MDIKKILENVVLMFSLSYNKQIRIVESDSCYMLLQKTISGGSLMIIRIFKCVNDRYCIIDDFVKEKGLVLMEELPDRVIRTMEDHYQVWEHHI